MYCHSGIQKYGGNPGNLTRLNGFRVHSIYMIRFPPRQNRFNKAFCFLYGDLIYHYKIIVFNIYLYW